MFYQLWEPVHHNLPAFPSVPRYDWPDDPGVLAQQLLVWRDLELNLELSAILIEINAEKYF